MNTKVVFQYDLVKGLSAAFVTDRCDLPQVKQALLCIPARLWQYQVLVQL